MRLFNRAQTGDAVKFLAPPTLRNWTRALGQFAIYFDGRLPAV